MMKLKRFATVILFSSVMLFTSREAQAFYNPSTGRWLSRDPIEHESPYAFSKNNPACKIDILGLAAIDTVHLMMEKAVMNTFSASAWTTGLPEFLMREWKLVSRIKAQYGTPGKGKNALWLPASDTMVVGGAKDNHNPVTIVHEMTHAVQDLELNYPFNNERMEEGEAYAIQAYYELGVRLTIDEGKYRRSECRVDRIKSLWQTFWKQFGVVPGEWGMVSWSEGGEPLQFSDLRAANERFKVRLSCSKLADEVNTILEDLGCCLIVTCSGQESDYEIPPGHPIFPYFR